MSMTKHLDVEDHVWDKPSWRTSRHGCKASTYNWEAPPALRSSKSFRLPLSGLLLPIELAWVTKQYQTPKPSASWFNKIWHRQLGWGESTNRSPARMTSHTLGGAWTKPAAPRRTAKIDRGTTRCSLLACSCRILYTLARHMLGL